VPAAACAALTAGRVKRHGHPITGFELADVLADLPNDAADFVSQYMGQIYFYAHPTPVLLPGMPVAATNATALDFDERIRGAGRWIRYFLYFNGFSKPGHYGCFHDINLLFAYDGRLAVFPLVCCAESISVGHIHLDRLEQICV
jgi:hypothetical protein